MMGAKLLGAVVAAASFHTVGKSSPALHPNADAFLRGWSQKQHHTSQS
jgi:hypothetical protein